MNGKYIIDRETLVKIADVIRKKEESTALIPLPEFFNRIDGLVDSKAPDGTDVTFGYVKQTVVETTPEGKAYYNGVLLPVIPEDALSNCPYIMILKHSEGNIYVYGSTSIPYFNVKSSVNRLELPSGRSRASYNADSDSWNTIDTSTSSTWCNLSENWSIVWSGFNIPNGSATATSIYFKATEPVTELTSEIKVPAEREALYSIAGADLNELAYVAQKVSGRAKLMTIEEIVHWLSTTQYIPQGNAESAVDFNIELIANASGILPVVHQGAASSEVDISTLSINTNAYCILPDVQQGTASSTLDLTLLAITSSAA